MSVLFDRLVRRMTRGLELARASGHFDVHRGSAERGYVHPDSLHTAEELAAVVEKTITRYVDALVPDPAVRRAVLEDGGLESGWILLDIDHTDDAGQILHSLWKNEAGEDVRQWKSPVAHAIQMVSTAEFVAAGHKHPRPPWPSNITIDELAAALEQTNDRAAQRLAKACHDGDLFVRPGDDRWQVRKELYTKEVPPLPVYRNGEVVGEEPSGAKEIGEALLAEGLTRWPVSVCAFVVSVEKRVRSIASYFQAARFAYTVVDELAGNTASGRSLRRRISESYVEGDDSNAVAELERELHDRVGRLRDALFNLDNLDVTDVEWSIPDATEQNRIAVRDGARLEDGMLAWDAIYAGVLEQIGERGKVQAESIRHNARARAAKAVRPDTWKLWIEPTSVGTGYRFATVLAQVLWADVVKPRLDEARRKPPALAMVIHEPVAHLFARARREEERDGQRALLLTDVGETIVRVDAVDADALRAVFVDRGIKLFGSVTAHHLLRWEIRQGHRQALLGAADPRLLRVDGGYSALAHEGGDAGLGLKSKKAAEQVRAIVEAQNSIEVPLPPDGTYSRLLNRRFTPAVGRRKAYLEIVLGTALLPDYVHELRRELGHSLEARRSLRLVPVLGLPPPVGRERDHGPQATLSMFVVAFMRDAATELVADGAVRIDRADLVRLASAAGVPLSTLDAILDRWTQDGTDAPAFLRRVAPDRYTLGETHAAALELMVDGGKRELEGRKAGKASAARRREKLGRKGR